MSFFIMRCAENLHYYHVFLDSTRLVVDKSCLVNVYEGEKSIQCNRSA